VSDADRNPNKRARAQARREFFIATLARTLTAVYCLAYTRALMHMKLLVLRRTLAERRTLGAQREYLGGVGCLCSEGGWPAVTDGGQVRGIEEKGASERGVGGEREREREKERERERERALSAASAAMFLSMLDGPFAISLWANELSARCACRVERLSCLFYFLFFYLLLYSFLQIQKRYSLQYSPPKHTPSQHSHHPPYPPPPPPLSDLFFLVGVSVHTAVRKALEGVSTSHPYDWTSTLQANKK
jgi:hypothetical protein